MKKSLSEMSLQELWELFPIRLTAYQQCWKGWFEQEREALTGSLQETGLVRLSHIGSTAVAGIWAKPIIDILAEFNAAGETERIQAALKANGYRCMSRGSGRGKPTFSADWGGFRLTVWDEEGRRIGPDRLLVLLTRIEMENGEKTAVLPAWACPS